MKAIRFGLCLVAAAGLFAQGRGAVGGSGGRIGGGRGSGGMGGAGHAPTGMGTPRGFSGILGASHTGFRGGYFNGSATRLGIYGGGYYVPYFDWGWNYGYGTDNYGSDGSPNVTVIYPPASAPPAVIPVYVERARPVMREYDSAGREVSVPAAQAASPIYLIAFQDQTIRAASSYRVAGAILHYVTLQGEGKQAALDTVDRDFSVRLNRERGVTLQLSQ